MSDPYSVLGIERNASTAEIKRAYRQLAKEFHPDVNPDDQSLAERFKEISAAYSLLADPARRKRFDAAGLRGTWGAGFDPMDGPDRDFVPFDERFGKGDREADLFGDIAGNRRGRGGTSMWLKGEDMFSEAELPFLDAAAGTKVPVTLYSGETLEFPIPADVGDGEILKYEGYGFPGYGGGTAGDLNLQIKVEPHEVLRREGDDIAMELTVTPDQVAAGATVTVPTIDGNKEIRLPRNADSGDVIHIAGAGVANRKTKERGDQHITLIVAGRGGG